MTANIKTSLTLLDGVREYQTRALRVKAVRIMPEDNVEHIGGLGEGLYCLRSSSQPLDMSFHSAFGTPKAGDWLVEEASGVVVLCREGEFTKRYFPCVRVTHAVA